MRFPDSITLRDVTLRDGFQSEAAFVPTVVKRSILQQLVQAGFRSIEVTSFVHPKWIPALVDADDFAQGLPHLDGVEYRALVPNAKGLSRFLAAPALQTAVFFLSASTAHNEANVNRSTEDSLREITPLIQQARQAGRYAVGAVATSFVCPFRGIVPFADVTFVAKSLVEAGVQELSIADTVGRATPRMVYERCAQLRDQFPNITLSLHLHNARGYGLANVLAGMAAGVDIYDVAQGGLGGCPYAPGAPGNLSADAVHQFLITQGIQTGIDAELLASVQDACVKAVKGG